VKKLDMAGKDELVDYAVKLKTDEMTAIVPTDKRISLFDKRLVISNSAYGNLFVIDLKDDRIFQVDYTPQLTAKSKKGGYPNEVKSQKALKEVMEKIYAEINFQAPFWDAENKRYYRFSYETTPTGNTDGPLFQSAEQKPISNVYITIFDENFKVLGESLLSGIKAVPSHPFAKDGIIWSYINVDDELGFVRLSINN
jgi:hypothetical protein